MESYEKPQIKDLKKYESWLSTHLTNGEKTKIDNQLCKNQLNLAKIASTDEAIKSISKIVCQMFDKSDTKWSVLSQCISACNFAKSRSLISYMWKLRDRDYIEQSKFDLSMVYNTDIKDRTPKVQNLNDPYSKFVKFDNDDELD